MCKYSFYLNSHIIGFCLQNQKLESPYFNTPWNTLAVKGLKGVPILHQKSFGLDLFFLTPKWPILYKLEEKVEKH